MNIRPDYHLKKIIHLNDDERRLGEAVRCRVEYYIAEAIGLGKYDRETPRRVVDKCQRQAYKHVEQGKTEEFINHWMGANNDRETTKNDEVLPSVPRTEGAEVL